MMGIQTFTSMVIVPVTLLALGGGPALSRGEPSQVDFDECNRQAQTRLNPLTTETSSEPPAPRFPWPRRAPRTASPPEPARDMDESLRGMNEVGIRNEHYRKAYRACLEERGF